jgi:hypothetical protein
MAAGSLPDVKFSLRAVDKTRGAFSSVNKGLSSVTRSAAIATATVAATTIALSALSAKASELSKRLLVTSKVTGATVEQLQQLDALAFREIGTRNAFSDMGGFAAELKEKIGDATKEIILFNQAGGQGNIAGDISEAFKLIGINATEMNRLDMVGQLSAIAKALDASGDAAVHFADTVFGGNEGRKFLALAPMLKDATALNEEMAKAPAISREQLIVVKEMGNSWDRLSKTISNKVVTSLADVLVKYKLLDRAAIDFEMFTNGLAAISLESQLAAETQASNISGIGSMIGQMISDLADGKNVLEENYDFGKLSDKAKILITAIADLEKETLKLDKRLQKVMETPLKIIIDAPWGLGSESGIGTDTAAAIEIQTKDSVAAGIKAGLTGGNALKAFGDSLQNQIFNSLSKAIAKSLVKAAGVSSLSLMGGGLGVAAGLAGISALMAEKDRESAKKEERIANATEETARLLKESSLNLRLAEDVGITNATVVNRDRRGSGAFAANFLENLSNPATRSGISRIADMQHPDKLLEASKKRINDTLGAIVGKDSRWLKELNAAMKEGGGGTVADIVVTTAAVGSKELADAMGALSSDMIRITNSTKEANEAEKSLARTREASREGIKNYLNDLRLGDKSTLSMSEKLKLAADKFGTTSALAESGDQNAINALRKASDDYLTVAREFGASGEAYQAAFDQVTDVLEKVADPEAKPDIIVTLELDGEAIGKAVASYSEESTSRGAENTGAGVT